MNSRNHSYRELRRWWDNTQSKWGTMNDRIKISLAPLCSRCWTGRSSGSTADLLCRRGHCPELGQEVSVVWHRQRSIGSEGSRQSSLKVSSRRSRSWCRRRWRCRRRRGPPRSSDTVKAGFCQRLGQWRRIKFIKMNRIIYKRHDSTRVFLLRLMAACGLMDKKPKQTDRKGPIYS